MKRNLRALAAAGVLFGALSAGDTALAQKSGGVLKIYFFDSPASMSIHEEATIAAEGPMMGVFNNLVMYKQDVPQSGFQSIVPDLATDWSWDEDKTQLTFRLREGVRWHDGKPFTAKDVVCTWCPPTTGPAAPRRTLETSTPSPLRLLGRPIPGTGGNACAASPSATVGMARSASKKTRSPS